MGCFRKLERTDPTPDTGLTNSILTVKLSSVLIKSEPRSCYCVRLEQKCFQKQIWVFCFTVTWEHLDRTVIIFLLENRHRTEPTRIFVTGIHWKSHLHSGQRLVDDTPWKMENQSSGSKIMYSFELVWRCLCNVCKSIRGNGRLRTLLKETKTGGPEEAGIKPQPTNGVLWPYWSPLKPYLEVGKTD